MRMTNLYEDLQNVLIGNRYQFGDLLLEFTHLNPEGGILFDVLNEKGIPIGKKFGALRDAYLYKRVSNSESKLISPSIEGRLFLEGEKIDSKE